MFSTFFFLYEIRPTSCKIIISCTKLLPRSLYDTNRVHGVLAKPIFIVTLEVTACVYLV